MTSISNRPIRNLLLFIAIAVVLSVTSFGMITAQTSGLGGAIAVAQEQVEPDRILIEVDMEASGSAQWHIHYRSLLRDNETTEAFSTIEEDIATDPGPYTDRFGERINQTVSDASTVTGREMSVTNLSVSTDRVFIPEEYGVVTYSFTWEQFGVPAGGEIRVGDAIAGMFLDETTRLQITYPDTYTAEVVEPAPSSQRVGMVSWRGPIDFNADEPTVILTSQGGADETASIGMPIAVGVLVILLIIGGTGVYLRKRQSSPIQMDEDRELLSNEEQVLNVLKANGGRMKQQELVQELEWTDAKTSQVVGNLRDAGKIEGFRLGRENVLKLSDTDSGE